jgi:hypothetical protein
VLAVGSLLAFRLSTTSTLPINAAIAIPPGPVKLGWGGGEFTVAAPSAGAKMLRDLTHLRVSRIAKLHSLQRFRAGCRSALLCAGSKEFDRKGGGYG